MKDVEKNFNYLAKTIKNVPFFTGLNDKEITTFLKHSHIHQYIKGSQIFAYGEQAKNFYIIIDGWVKLYHINADGGETVISLLTKGETFGESATFEDSEYNYNAQVVEGKAKLVTIPSKIIRNIVIENSTIALKMLGSISQHLLQLGLNFEHVTKLSTTQRIGCFLLKLLIDNNLDKSISLPYNKYIVASRLGMQPETLSRGLLKLHKDLDLSIKGRKITVSNIEELLSYCKIGCAKNNSCKLDQYKNCQQHDCDVYRILHIM